MTVLALILVAGPFILAAYAYAIYPAILWLLARRGAADVASAGAALPLVTVVIPAYNEEAQITGAVESMLAQDYPADRRQILVLSDASTDATDVIVRGYTAHGVELLRMPVRAGKTAAENAAFAHIRGDIVINTDASVRFKEDGVRRLVAAMADSRVGVASTTDVSVTRAAGGSAAEAGYVDYEMRVRSLETKAGGIVGASGSGYAIRTELHRKPVRADLSRDFSAALTAHREGFRAVSVADAICFVPRTPSLEREYRRKVRTISRGMATLYFNRDLLNPGRHGAFAWKLLTHKLCRWLVPLSTLLALFGLLLLSPTHIWSRYALAAAGALGILAVIGARWPDTRKVPSWLHAGTLGALASNLAVIHASWRFIRGHRDHIWEPTRRPHAQAEQDRLGSA